MYLRTEYEQALILFHKAQRERPHCRLAIDGIRRCRDSLNTTLVRKLIVRHVFRLNYVLKCTIRLNDDSGPIERKQDFERRGTSVTSGRIGTTPSNVSRIGVFSKIRIEETMSLTEFCVVDV